MEKSRVLEIQVRMDCNGCVQKIKKALQGIYGIQAIYMNIPQQILTIIGWADPGKIVQAIKKTRKHANIICLETKPSPQPKPPSESDAPPKERENPPPEPAQEPFGSNKAEEVQHCPPDHSHRYSHEQVYNASVTHYSPSTRYKPIHVNHNYNTYKPTPYVTEYTHIPPPPHYSRPEPEPPKPYTNYSREEPPPQYTHYDGECHNSSYGNGSITSIFSDDNPNACTIV